MRAVVRHLLRGREPLWGVLLLVITFVSFFSFLLPSSFKAVVDSLLPRGDERLFHQFCAILLVLVLTRSMLNALQDYLFLRVRQLVEKGLLGRYFASVIHLPLSRWNTLGEADLVNRITQILTHFQLLLPELVYYCAYALCVSLAVMAVLYLVNPLFLLLSLGFLVLHATNFFLHYRLSRRFSAEYAAGRGRLADAYRDLLRGRKFITLSGLEQPLLDSLDRDNRRLHQSSFRRDLAESGLSLWQQLLQGLTYLSLVVVGTLSILDGTLSVGSMGLSLLLIGFAYEPVYRLSRLTKALSETEAQFARVLPLLSGPPPREDPAPAPSPLERLELRGLSFERSGTEVLRDTNAVFVPGHLYLLTGASGSGKTTLFHLLSGFLPPTRGEVLWNGREVSTLSRSELAGWLTYCPQQSLLLDGTVGDNITLFSETPDTARMARALKLATAEQFMDLERAARLEVENEGANFSGGQKQRLHLARAWYQAAPVMLFDEPTAHLDAETEELFLQRLASQAEGRILLLISHSPAARRHATRVLRLSGGTLQPLE